MAGDVVSCIRCEAQGEAPVTLLAAEVKKTAETTFKSQTGGSAGNRFANAELYSVAGSPRPSNNTVSWAGAELLKMIDKRQDA